MAKQQLETNTPKAVPVRFEHIIRMVVPVPHRKIDQTEFTEQGLEQDVSKLVQDYVLGRLDPRRLGGGSYDDESSEEVDPFNNFGITFEQVSDVSDAARNAAANEKQRKGKVADHPIDSSKQQKKEDKPAEAKNDEP